MRWMIEHQAEVKAMLGDRHMDWTEAAKAFGTAGLTDHHGRAPTAEAAEAIWRRANAPVRPTARQTQ